MELHLRALHALLPAAYDFPGLAAPYVNFLRSLRERLHPIGVRDIRRIEPRPGLVFHVDLGDRLGSDLYYGYWAELFESELFLRMLDPGAAVVDIGANFGYYAISAARRVGDDGVVYAFEPDGVAFDLLQRSIVANDLRNVNAYQICVGATDGETEFYLMEEPAFSSRSMTGRARLREKTILPISTLDSLLAEAGVSTVAGLKVDVEGHEFEVLQGGRETIRQSPNIVVIFEVNGKNLNAERREGLASVLSDCYQEGFRAWVADFGPDGLRALPAADEIDALGSANVLLVRRGSLVEDRLIETARALREEAFQGVAQHLTLDHPKAPQRNAADPYHPLKLHGAVMAAALRDREALIETLRARLQAVEADSQMRLQAIEADSQMRLQELRLAQAVIQGLRDQMAGAERSREDLEKSSRQMGEELERLKLDGPVMAAALRDREALIETLGARLQAIEADSQMRLQELRLAQSVIQGLRDQMAGAERSREDLEKSSRQMGEELERRRQEVADRERARQTLQEEVRMLAARLTALEAESTARLAALREREAQVEAAARERGHLQREVDLWKAEATVGIGVRLRRALRALLFGG